MYVDVYVCILYAYMCAFIRLYVYTYIRIYVCVYTHKYDVQLVAFIQFCIDVHVCIHMKVQIPSPPLCRMCISMYANIHVQVRILFPPLWSGQHFDEFSESYHNAGYELDTWLTRYQINK
jgi:hypothetical protein